MLERKTRLRQINRPRRLERFSANYGSERRVLWFHEQPCACRLPVLPDPSVEAELEDCAPHPACAGVIQVSHTTSKAIAGDETTCIPQTAGCHGYIQTKGWNKWCREVAELHGLETLDRHELAADYAMRGPDAPMVMP